MDDRKQKTGESFVDFYYDILSMTMPLKIPLSESELLEILKKNMRIGLITHLAGRPLVSVSELVTVCISTEDTWKRIGYSPDMEINKRPYKIQEMSRPQSSLPFNFPFFSSSGPSQPSLSKDNVVLSPCQSTEYYSPHDVNEINYNSSLQYNPNVAPPEPRYCFNCGQTGHNWFRCDLPSKTFCYVCGKSDVKTIHCPNCSMKAENASSEMRRNGPSYFRQQNAGPRAILQRPTTPGSRPNLVNLNHP